jgi:phospholipid/cholesterol/gamma-HCH transport system permease protein
MKTFLLFFEELGKLSLFLKEMMVLWFSHQISPRETAKQIAQVTAHSFVLVCFSGVFVGSIMLIQFHLMLSNYQAVHLIGGLNTSAFIRNIGPLITSLLLAGKIGAYTAAELANMRITDQIEAMECLGINAKAYLIGPRWLGIVLSSFVLFVLTVGSSIIGSMIMANLLFGVNDLEYFSTIPRFASFPDIIKGSFKSFFFSLIVATVSCYYGFYAKGGARGVGMAVTKSTIYIHLHTVLSNYVLTEILNLLFSKGE